MPNSTCPLPSRRYVPRGTLEHSTAFARARALLRIFFRTSTIQIMAESPITPRQQDFAAWYQDVTLQGDMAEPAEIVKGCMVIKANGYAVWERLQRELDDPLQSHGPLKICTSRC